MVFAVDDGEQEIVLAGREDVRVGNRSRCDDASHLAFHELHSFLDGLHLIANGNLVSLAQQPRDVAVCGVIGNSAHGNGIVAVFVASGKRNFQFARGSYGVIEEEFVEIAQPEEQQGIRSLLLDGVVLPHHGGEILVLHGKTVFYPKKTAASSKTLGSSSFCDSASSIGTATMSVPRSEAI